MNEKIYCWGQVNEKSTSALPVLLNVPKDCLGVCIDRKTAFAWTESKIFNWGNVWDADPRLCQSSQGRIERVGLGIDGPLVVTEKRKSSLSSDEGLEKDLKGKSSELVQVVHNFSGYVTLDKSHNVRSSYNNTEILNSVVQVSAECSSFFALKSQGTVFKWAHIHPPSDLDLPEKIISISSGSQHSIFTTENQDIYVLGSNSYGQISLPNVSEVQVPVKLPGLKASQVACGGFHSVLMTVNRQVLTCGLGNMGQLISNNFNNCEIFSLRLFPSDFGEVSEVFSAELASFVKFLSKEQVTQKSTEKEPNGSIMNFLYRQLVAAAERSFLEKVKEEVKSQKLAEKKRLQREKRAQDSLVLFENEILPNWDVYHHSKELSELIKQGLPSKFRGNVWWLLHLSKSRHLSINYEELAKSLKELKNKNDLNEEQGVICTSFRLIYLDISRTFNNLGYFAEESPLSKDLQSLLELACIYRPDIGYIQGMSYVAGMLLLNLDPCQSFSLFIQIITSPVLLPFFKIDQEGIHRRTELFLTILLENLPEVHSKLEEEAVQLPVILMEWFVTIYSRTLCQEVSVRVWDLYFYFGELVLFKVGIAVLKAMQNDILSNDISEVLAGFSHVGEKILEPDLFIADVETVKVSENVGILINSL